MIEGLARHAVFERLFARVLDHGTWLASAIIGCGWLLAAAGSKSSCSSTVASLYSFFFRYYA